jgi:hypothetical protein
MATQIENRNLSASELSTLKSKTNGWYIKIFENTESHYRSICTWICFQEERLVALDSKPIAEQIKLGAEWLNENLKHLYSQKSILQKELETIASRTSDTIIPVFSMPENFGTVDVYECEHIKGIPIFDPNQNSCRLSRTWYMMKKFAKSNKWSKSCLKNVLSACLRGKAAEFYFSYQNRDLEELINILGKKFENHIRKSDFESKLNKFRMLPKESLLKAISRLQYIINCLYCDLPVHEQKFLEEYFLKEKLRKMVHNDVWESTILLQKLHEKDGQTFDFVLNIQLQDKKYPKSKK